MRKRYVLVLGGLALAVTIAACTDVPAPRTQEGGGAVESADTIEPVDPPKKIEKGVVPDVVHVQAEEAEMVVTKAGFEPELESLALVFTTASINDGDVICTIEPPADSTPPKNSTVVLTYDEKCQLDEETDDG